MSRNKCSVCQREDDGSNDTELRPYGAHAALICFGCMMASPERQKEAEKQFEARLSAVDVDGGIAIIGPREGPLPLPDLVVTRDGKVLTDQKRGIQEFKEQSLRREDKP